MIASTLSTNEAESSPTDVARARGAAAHIRGRDHRPIGQQNRDPATRIAVLGVADTKAGDVGDEIARTLAYHGHNVSLRSPFGKECRHDVSPDPAFCGVRRFVPRRASGKCRKTRHDRRGQSLCRRSRARNAAPRRIGRGRRHRGANGPDIGGTGIVGDRRRRVHAAVGPATPESHKFRRARNGTGLRNAGHVPGFERPAAETFRCGSRRTFGGHTRA